MSHCKNCGAESQRLFDGLCAKCMSVRAMKQGIEQEAEENGSLPDIQINEPGINLIDVLRRMKQPYHGAGMIGADGLPDKGRIFDTRYGYEALKRKFGTHWKNASTLASKWKTKLMNDNINDGGNFGLIPTPELMANLDRYELCEGLSGVSIVCLKGTNTDNI